MANPTRNEATVKLGNNTYKLKATMDAVAIIENELPRSITQIYLGGHSIRFNELRVITLYTAQAINPNVDVEQLEQDLMDEGIASTVAQIFPFIGAIFSGAPKDKPTEKKATK